MLENLEEKEKCLEKLNEMQKFLPFLDFMIDKINKKNNEIPLDCQLSKFQLLRSMIAEKTGKYNWNIIVKIEDVIEKLIFKLDYKEEYGSQYSEDAGEREREKSVKDSTEEEKSSTSMAAAVTIIPSSTTTTISVTSATGSSQVSTVDSRPQDTSTSTVGLIMKQLKMSIDGNSKQNAFQSKEIRRESSVANDLENSMNETTDANSTGTTNLDKDLDGFELMDCSSLSDLNSSNNSVDAKIPVISEVLTSHDDLLSSSREKLLKSLEKKLSIGKTDRQTHGETKDRKKIDSQISSAFSHSKSPKSSTDRKGETDRNLPDRHHTNGSPLSGSIKTPLKPFYADSALSDKNYNTSRSSSGFHSSKQKLREKLSADICEVYKVSGKSVGGSLRSLKDQKKSSFSEEEELFKPDKVTEVYKHRRHSTEHKDKPNRNSSSFLSEKKSGLGFYVDSSGGSGDGINLGKEKKESEEHGRNSERETFKNVKDAEDKKKSSSAGGEVAKKDKNFELDKLDDNELLEFVKDNMQSLPHLSKLKPFELRKAVNSSLQSSTTGLSDAEDLSEDSFQDLDEFMNNIDKEENSNSKKSGKAKETESNSFASVKISEMVSEEVAKNAKPIVDSNKDSEDKTLEEDDGDDEDFAQKLIEETTPKVFPPKKKKGLLELPLPLTENLVDDIFTPDSPEQPTFTNDVRDPRLNRSSETKNKTTLGTKSEQRPVSHAEPIKLPSEMLSPGSNLGIKANVPKDSFCGSKTGNFISSSKQEENLSGKLQQNMRPPEGFYGKEKTDTWGMQQKHIPQDPGQYPQYPNVYPMYMNESMYINSCPYPYLKPMYNSDPPPYQSPYHSSEPKSYAEYKRMKQKEQEKLNQLEATQKEKPKDVPSESSGPVEASRPPPDKEGSDGNGPPKPLDNRLSKFGDSYENQKNTKKYENRRKSTDKRRFSDYNETRPREDSWGRRSKEEETRKEDEQKRKTIGDEKRHSLDSEEIVSPLEKLYENENKPKTGRGYGLQNFKIPKKVRETSSTEPLKKIENQENRKETAPKSSVNEDSSPQPANAKNEVATVEESNEKSCDADDENKSSSTVDSTNVSCVENSRDDGEKKVTESTETKTDKSESEVTSLNIGSKTETKEAVMSVVPDSSASVDEKIQQETLDSKKSALENEEVSKSQTEISSSTESVKKVEAQIVECDSSVECVGANPANPNAESKTETDKETAASKEEITQEFVEALIRKSFQSGEGKLLLAQAKLFEELARKLNSKKLKTIQKIINSESDSSSSTSSDSSSDEEITKKKSKKSDEKSSKSKKKKKKLKKKKYKLSSSSEDETVNEEVVNKPEVEEKAKEENEGEAKTEESESLPTEKNEKDESKDISEEQVTTAEDAVESSVSTNGNIKNKTKRRAKDVGKCISRKKMVRRQGQKKLLEEMMNEPSRQEVAAEVTDAAPVSVPEQKTKTRTKGKGKTELDRLQEDIKNMFICSGVVTATGQRMCRILKESGGNMNNLDIAKESAKMVKEQKLKRQTRCRSRNSQINNSNSAENRSRSQSLDKTLSSRDGSKTPKSENIPEATKSGDAGGELKALSLHIEDSKRQPMVVLQRVDLNNFGYGERISDDCLSFARLKGRNTALKGKQRPGFASGKKSSKNRLERSPTRGVYLARNLRKYKLMKSTKTKKRYIGKKIMDVVKNLPLKMAKMKHLDMSSIKIGEKSKDSGKKGPGRPPKKKDNLKLDADGISSSEDDILNYAFEKKRSVYPCILCSYITRNITAHFKVMHPESEVLISRLSRVAAKRAIAESVEKKYNSPRFNQTSSLEMIKQRVKSKLSGTVAYNCRMCNTPRINDSSSFYAHVSTHTGEFRFRCPADNCDVTMAYRENVKYHILTKHSYNKNILYNKIIELFPVPVEWGRLFGYLCSECNYVQMSLMNVENHIQRNHSTVKSVKIIKIDMSGTENEKKSKKMKTSIRFSLLSNARFKSGYNDSDSEKADSRGSGEDEGKLKIQKKQSETRLLRKRKLKMLEDSINDSSVPDKKDSEDEGAKNSKVKKFDFGREDGNKKDGENAKSDSGDESVSSGSNFKTIEVVERGDGDESENGETDVLINLKNSESAEESEILNSIEIRDKSEDLGNVAERQENPLKLKVGPLEAQIFGNSCVLYECYVKGCLFSTKVYDLFEKHIKITHSTTKWDGNCQLCWNKGETPTTMKPLKLVFALKHLKIHERVQREKNLKQEIEDGGDNESEGESSRCGVAESENLDSDPKKKNESSKKSAVDAVFPPKPLLRVRNLLGDRLSTPKDPSEEDDDVVPLNKDEDSTMNDNQTETKSELPVMFTIEDVRSLKQDDESEDTELQVQQIVTPGQIAGNIAMKSKTFASKPVVVRSCPTRKIAILPESNNPYTIEVGQLKMIPCPPTAQSVVLSPHQSNSPLQIISGLPTSPNQLNFQTGNVVSIIRTVTSPTTPTLTDKTTSTSSPESSSSTAKSKMKFRTKVYRPSKTELVSDQEETEQKDGNKIQRLTSSSTTANKSFKDAKVYQEMLTKKKLCHLFKCMAVECSFTCNNENVFTQHLGLHEAQKRITKQRKCMTFYIDNANKMKKLFYWQQCAYCCELLVNTSSALSQHILTEHGHCVYQCAYCFYRAVSQSYVEIHQNLAHSNILKTTSRVIYKCKPLSTGPPQPSALEKQGKRQTVRPYHCDQCGRKFFITQDFLDHLTTEHQSVTAYTCHICKNLCFKANRLIGHYKLHSYSIYQCPYCLHGTETEKEMVFHLCNFHFSQPAYTYVRALAQGQKFSNAGLLDSLKVIVYESKSADDDCVEEADPEEDETDTPNVDLSVIVSELGINAENVSSSSMTPLMKELASLGEGGSKNLSLKTLLPNAQFSSENEGKTESCSVFISTGSTSTTNDEDLNVPLGQLSVTPVDVQNSKSPAPIEEVSQDESVKGNAGVGDHSQKSEKKKKSAQTSGNKQEKQSKSVGSAFKLPSVTVSRQTKPVNVYPAKAPNISKENPDETGEESEVDDSEQSILYNMLKICTESEEGGEIEGVTALTKEVSLEVKSNSGLIEEAEESNSQPVISNVVSLSTNSFEKDDCGKDDPPDSESIIITDICSLTSSLEETTKDSHSPRKIIINIQSKVDGPKLKPPIIRVEDYPIEDGDIDLSKNKKDKESDQDKGNATVSSDSDKNLEAAVDSPELIILDEEKTVKGIETVTIDSEDEKESEEKPSKKTETVDETKDSTGGESSVDDTIRKEIEILRNKIASETDSLLFDESENKHEAEVKVIPEEKPAVVPEKPTTEAANAKSKDKKIPVESVKEKEKEEKEVKKEEKVVESGHEAKSESSTKVVEPRLPRTRSGLRGKKESEATEKSDSDDSYANASAESEKEDGTKGKKFVTDLTGKDLFICGNEKCNFATTEDTLLKEHLYVCDLSRDSSVLVCPHCSKKIKLFNTYVEHIKHHGVKKFFCGLCEFSSAILNNLTRHLKQKHKAYQLISVPKDPPNESHLLYYPKNHRIEEKDFEVNGYSPGDEDKLPLQSVYQVNVKCAKCPYFTKVRSNMVRHLKIHVKSVETEGVVVVPSTAPTNPVPCLDTKEKMFDKMTNLAASSQLAQAKEKTAMETLSSEEEAKLPQFVAEQMRYKCCLPDCNYITIDDSMLKHHIKALHDEISYYSCPHCQPTVHVDVRHVTLEKIGHHLKHHDAKLYKCANCIYFHYQKSVVEKHTIEKHPDRKYFIYTVREPKPEVTSEEEHSSGETGIKAWKCGLCNEFQSISRVTIMDHLAKKHNTKSKYKCQFCLMKSNHYQSFFSHFAAKHAGEKVAYLKSIIPITARDFEGQCSGADSSNEHFDTTPLWQRGAPRVRHIRGILIEEEEVKTKKSKRMSEDNESEPEISEAVTSGNAFYCPLCTDKKKIFYTRNADYFRSHLYQELNYQQFACILCGKMFIDKKDFGRHHAKAHPDKPLALKQTKEDGEIIFWVDKVIAKQREQMEVKKRRLSEESSDSQGVPKKKKEV